MAFVRKQMRMHRKGLSVPQFRTLVWIDRHPAETLSCLAEHLGASLPTASRIVAGLVAKGLLVRKGREEDRRQVALGITPAGRAVLDAAWCATRSEMERRLGELSVEQQRVVSSAMQVLRSVFGALECPPDCREGGAAGGEV